MTGNELLVSDARLAARLDDDGGFNANGATPYVFLLIAGNVMVWLLGAAADGRIARTALDRKPVGVACAANAAQASQRRLSNANFDGRPITRPLGDAPPSLRRRARASSTRLLSRWQFAV